MTALLLDFWPYLAAAGLALVAVVKAYLSGRKSERNANRAKEADAYEKHLQDLAAANRAGAAIRPDDRGMLNDPRNRDR